jgi:hypothetical protein
MPVFVQSGQTGPLCVAATYRDGMILQAVPRSLFTVLGSSLLLLTAGCSGGGDSSGSSTISESPSRVPTHLDCGSSVAGSERALRQFFTVLRTGNETQIRSVLANRRRFFWLGVNSAGPHGPQIEARPRHRPGRAARSVAQLGRLPLRVVSFTNSEPPPAHGTTDFGFTGRWNGTRRVVGKAAIACTHGKAIVLSVFVRRR